ncbi:jg24717 [Pararge aegeria aegeria]|uniref:Jg24717 protein n=1 Tax=Pararge aegeria aegeria TaxID=348720 RepID=A0A8S4QT09_9NEOP|nr:jg24717 [Pararge aegeria aegeria]
MGLIKKLVVTRAMERAMLGVSLRDQIKNKDIRRKTVLGHIDATPPSGECGCGAWERRRYAESPSSVQRYVSAVTDRCVTLLLPAAPPLACTS